MANPNNPAKVGDELCLHLKEAIAAAAKGDEIARAWLLQTFPANRVWLEMAWGQAQPTLEELREVSRARIEHLYRLLGQEQQTFNDLTLQLQYERRLPMISEIVAGHQRWETEKMQQEQKVAAERYAKQQQAEAEAQKCAKERTERVALEHQQRAERDAANMAKKRQELIAGGFMPA